MPSSEHKKAWVLTPNRDYTATGVLQAGQILTDYMDSNSAVLHNGTNPIPKETLLVQSTHVGVNYGSMDMKQVAFHTWIKENLMKAIGGTFHRRLWLVTGLRVLGKGAEVTEAFIQKSSVAIAAEGDGTTVNCHPFAYAYRLHEIIVRRKLENTEWRAFGGRQAHGIDGNDSDDSDVEPEIVGYEVLGVEAEPFIGDGDDDETCSLLVDWL
ncbi:hypothetical protein F4859DRAFT_515770 [Xylaria cf. heliscus]|nr:hypothetical protein F4859DRAFT_515770 [Xylaria cf. heliscus]